MKNLTFTLLLLYGMCSFAQTGMTAIPGTKCSMIPPPGFAQANAFSGFQNAEGASIVIIELDGPYEEIRSAFTEDALKKQDMTLLKKETIDFNGLPATLAYVTQNQGDVVYNKILFLFGTNEHTVMVNGIYPENLKSIAPGLKNAMLTTVYNPSKQEDPLEAATFTINTQGTDFKATKNMSGVILYTQDGKTPSQKATLLVGNSLDKTNTNDKKWYAENRLKKLPYAQSAVITSTTQITIDGMDGYEIIAQSQTKEGKPNLLYQVMLFNNAGAYFIIVGQTEKDFETYTALFKKIALSFKRK